MPAVLRPRTRIIAALVATLLAAVAIAIAATILLRRAEVTDPAVLATMPLDELRDSELETLVRAAFQNAIRVNLAADTGHGQTERSVTITDGVALADLAQKFAIGPDHERLPFYEYPGITYTRVTIDGRFESAFSFSSENSIYVHGTHGRFLRVRTAFAMKIADLLHLEVPRTRRLPSQGSKPPSGASSID
ncbi:MAG: hypothetical protein K2Y37_12790 [Pirellulales bacterium]|nr:hypothetical protein [Pirellulales bacterium]